MKIGADELSPVTQLFTEDYIIPYPRHEIVPERFVICRNHIPGRVAGAGRRHGFGVEFRVTIPMTSLV